MAEKYGEISSIEGFMKKSILLFATLGMVLYSCDTPRDRRATPIANGNQYSFFNPNSTTSGSSSSDTGPRTSDGSDTTTGTTTSGGGTTAPAIPTEISHCSWSMDGQNGFSNFHQSIGSYTLCKSKTSAMDIYIQLKTPSTDAQICIIPTTNSGGNSTYIGEPRCLMIDTNSKVYKVTLYKNRPGYSSYSFTGVMAMKDKSYFYPYPFNRYMLSPDAYMHCANLLAETGDSAYCNSFNSVGQYVYQTF